MAGATPTDPGAATSPSSDVGAREQEFWDAHVPSLDSLAAKYAAGPDPNTRAMLDAVEPVAGRRVLDFACGAGVTAAFLAQRGAIVTAIDISPESIARGRELVERLGLSVEFVAGELTSTTFAPESFDGVVGHYALHHVDLTVIAPIFNEILRAGGRGGFVETMGLNPLLSFSRSRLAGRSVVASYGSDDERPLDRADLRVLEHSIGPVRLSAAELRFLRIFDRNVLRYRWPIASRALAVGDDVLSRLGADVLSYHQVVSVVKPAERPGSELPG